MLHLLPSPTKKWRLTAKVINSGLRPLRLYRAIRSFLSSVKFGLSRVFFDSRQETTALDGVLAKGAGGLEGAATREIASLRRLLRMTPYWCEGHLLLGERALLLNDAALAYGAALGALRLSKRPQEEWRAQSLVGECYLRKGMHQEAFNIFSRLDAAQPGNRKVQENLAASYIALDRHSEAARVLRQIPDTEISQEGKAALLYLTRREKDGMNG